MSKIKELNQELEKSSEELFVLHNVEIDNLDNVFKVLEKDNIFQIVIGNNIVSKERFQYLDEAIEYLKKKPIDILINIIGIMIENFDEVKKFSNN